MLVYSNSSAANSAAVANPILSGHNNSQIIVFVCHHRTRLPTAVQLEKTPTLIAKTWN
jgi:hypothetical protein